MISSLRAHPFLTTGFAFATALSLFFAIRFGLDVIYWSDHEREAVRPWMTIGYVNRSWDIEPKELEYLAGLPLPKERPLTLQELADEQGIPVEVVIKRVEAAIVVLNARKQEIKKQ
jgi:hypothetical protein